MIDTYFCLKVMIGLIFLFFFWQGLLNSINANMAIYFEEIWQKVGIRSWNDSKKHCTNMQRNKDTLYMHVKKQKIHDMWSWNKQRCMAHTCKKKNGVESDCKKHDTCIHVMEQEWTITTWHVSRVVRVTVSGFLQLSFTSTYLIIFRYLYPYLYRSCM